MEGALPSVVAGLVDVPVIAVPTSVGYGASFDGMAALLGMMNSCAPGVAVVNIDNGFGAGYLASQMSRRAATRLDGRDPEEDSAQIQCEGQDQDPPGDGLDPRPHLRAV